jgi:hypothetical protein
MNYEYEVLVLYRQWSIEWPSILILQKSVDDVVVRRQFMTQLIVLIPNHNVNVHFYQSIHQLNIILLTSNVQSRSIVIAIVQMILMFQECPNDWRGLLNNRILERRIAIGECQIELYLASILQWTYLWTRSMKWWLWLRMA